MASETTRPDGVVIREISPLELKERLDRGEAMVMVDVRELFERHLADLPEMGQLRIPVKDIPFRGGDLDPNVTTVMYCRTGPRSAWATERLMEMGHRKVLNLKGGVMGWKDHVDPAIRSY